MYRCCTCTHVIVMQSSYYYSFTRPFDRPQSYIYVYITLSSSDNVGTIDIKFKVYIPNFQFINKKKNLTSNYFSLSVMKKKYGVVIL